jgi:hypothetical protein
MSAILQRHFVDALLDPDRAPPDGVTAHTAKVPRKRFDVYRNNVVAGLVNALRTRFPATERIIGGECFGATARMFIAAHPPRSRILADYGDELPDFLAAFAPLAHLPYLTDVVRLEAARTRAYHAADAEPLDPDGLRNLTPDGLWQVRLALHPSLEIVRSRYPVVTIWAMNAGEAELGPVDMIHPEDAMIVRPRDEVLVRTLPAGGAVMLAELQAGEALGQAAQAAAAECRAFDLVGNLAGLLASGVLAGPSLPSEEVKP